MSDAHPFVALVYTKAGDSCRASYRSAEQFRAVVTDTPDAVWAVLIRRDTGDPVVQFRRTPGAGYAFVSLPKPAPWPPPPPAAAPGPAPGPARDPVEEAAERMAGIASDAVVRWLEVLIEAVRMTRPSSAPLPAAPLSRYVTEAVAKNLPPRRFDFDPDAPGDRHWLAGVLRRAGADVDASVLTGWTPEMAERAVAWSGTGNPAERPRWVADAVTKTAPLNKTPAPKEAARE